MNIFGQIIDSSINDPFYKLFLFGCALANGNYGNDKIEIYCQSENTQEFEGFINEVSQITSLPYETCILYYNEADRSSLISSVKSCYNCAMDSLDHRHYLTFYKNPICCM